VLIPAIVAAAGGSSRYPGGKLLASYHGKPLLQWLLHRLSDHPGIGRILVVTGSQRAEVEALLYPYPRTRAIFNPRWREGLAESLKLGVCALPPTPGFLVALGDRPLFTDGTLDRVLPSSLGEGTRVRVPVFHHEPGYPVYFPARCRAGWRCLEGDSGVLPLLRLWNDELDRVSVHDPGVLMDFDTPEDFPAAETVGISSGCLA
jgi:molybdenum cofactor cytidylyltransferase